MGDMARITELYGVIVHSRVVLPQCPGRPLPTDVHVPDTDFGSVVMSMSKRHRAIISLDSLKNLHSQSVFQKMPQPFIVSLRHQVAEGRCTIVVNEHGELVR